MMIHKVALCMILAFIPLLVYSQESAWDEDEVLKYGFVSPLDRSFGLENKEISSIEELNKQIEDFFIPAELYFNAYNDLAIDSVVRKTDDILYVEYKLGGKQLKSFSLFKPTSNTEKTYKTATVIIPGSNENQSIEIFNGVGYHLNIANEIAALSDVYIATKPNQGYLALHRGGRKLDYTMLVNYMLNKGGSYSVSYIVNTLATVKYLKTIYDKIFVIGLSQGGAAALLNALQSSPDAAVIASGFSVTRELFEWAGHDQIIIPNAINVISNETIRESISKQNTNYFFSWGTNEIGTYKLEAENKYTYTFFKDIKNIECNFHDQGHSFPQPFTNDFLSKVPFASINLELTQIECGQDIYLKPVSLSFHNIVAYNWYRNDSLISTSYDTLMLRTGGRYKLIVETDEAKLFGSKELIIDSVHFKRKLYVNKSLLLAPKGFRHYQWYLNDQLLENEYGDHLMIKKEGTYTCCLTSDLGSFNSNAITINSDYTFIVSNIEALHVYPNPNNGWFTMVLTSPEVASDQVNILIYNVLGQKVYERGVILDSKMSEFDIDISDLQKGRYLIKAITHNKSFVKSIIIQ